MKRFVTILSAVVLLSSISFAQQPETKSFDALKKAFASTLKSNGYYGNASTQTNVRAVKFGDNGCQVDIQTLTKMNYQPWRETSFRDSTEVVPSAGTSWMSKENRTISFDLSQVDLENVLLEDGVAKDTSFIRVPLTDGFVTIRRKLPSVTEKVEQTKLATLVVKDDASQKAKQQLSELVSLCRSRN